MKIPHAYIRTLEQLMNYLPAAAQTIPGSLWTVGEHLEHCVAVNMSVLKGMTDSTRVLVKPLSFSGKVILFTGYIPRGKAKAPEAVKPRSGGNPEVIEKLHRIANGLLTTVSALETPNGFAHPYFGWLTPEQTFRFLTIHMRHHLKIVKKIP